MISLFPHMSAACGLVALFMVDAGCASPASEMGTAHVEQRKEQDETARRDAIATLASRADEQSCRALVPFLEDPEEDLRNRAAQALYDKCAGVAAEEASGPALRRAVTLGTTVAGAYLLLGRRPAQENVSALISFANRTSPVKLQAWMLPVPVSLPASVALLRAGQNSARERVLRALGDGSLAEIVFLLYVLDDINDPVVLKAAGALLSDRREISGGVPSHATPMRRVADLAVDALVARLKLKPSFPLSPSRRYSDAQLNEVRAALQTAL